MHDAWTEDLGFVWRKDGGATGDVVGVMWRPTAMDPKNMTRASARTAYYDPASKRPNLDILVGTYVAKVNTRGTKAIGVDVVSVGKPTAKLSIVANKEVVLALGALHTPQVLQLSGIGPARLLERLNITVVKNLPGVGANLQEHPSVRSQFKCTSLSIPFPPPSATILQHV